MGVDPSLPVAMIAGHPMDMAIKTMGRRSRVSIATAPIAFTFPPRLR
jgi:hypothetical protein